MALRGRAFRMSGAAFALVYAYACRCAYARICCAPCGFALVGATVTPMFTDTDITIPDPIDAAGLIVAAGSPRAGILRAVLGAFADQLAATGVFADLTARDTRTVAEVIAYEVVDGDEGDGLQARAAAITDGSSTGWHHPRAVARALAVAATILATW